MILVSTLRLPNGAVFAIGPRPPTGHVVARAGYSMLILAADTYQPPASAFPGVAVIRVGVPDDRRVPLTPAQLAAIKSASRAAAQHLASGRNVLFTCEQGYNRSALVAALALVHLGVPRARAMMLVRQMRFGALNNPRLAEIVAREPLS